MAPRNRKAGRHRLVDMTEPPPAWRPDLPAVTREERTEGLGAHAWCLVRVDRDARGRVVEWAVVQLRRVDGRVRRVAVFDTCHDKGVHVHHYDPEEREVGERTVRPVASHRELAETLDAVVAWLRRHWQENERRTDRGP